MADALVDVDMSGAVCTVTLNSPHNRNALSSQLLAELALGLRSATSDTSTRVIVLTATGTVFCSGADLSERGEFRSAAMEEVLTLIAEAPLPVITRVNGHARAGGLGLIAASDLAVAPAPATFAFTEVRVGVAPALIAVPALAVCDRRFLSRTMLTGEKFSAEEAAGAGLLTDVVPDDEAAMTWTRERVESILSAAPGAVAATKALLRRLPEQGFAEALRQAAAISAELFGGAEAAEGMEAFFAKRSPSWVVPAP